MLCFEHIVRVTALLISCRQCTARPAAITEHHSSGIDVLSRHYRSVGGQNDVIPVESSPAAYADLPRQATSPVPDTSVERLEPDRPIGKVTHRIIIFSSKLLFKTFRPNLD